MILGELRQQGMIKPRERPPKPHINAPLRNIDLKKFSEAMEESLASYSALEEQ
jgi:hypothetical protein